MLYARLDILDTYSPFLKHPVWTEALDWLRTSPPGVAAGIHQLRGEQMFVNVHGYATRTREACRYESHRRFIDLQYCVGGGEIVEWQQLSVLVPTDKYDSVKDVMHYGVPGVSAACLRMTSGSFAIFFPSDGHMPKVADGQHDRIEKMVIKVDISLFG